MTADLKRASELMEEATSGFTLASYALEGLTALADAGWTIEPPPPLTVMERLRRGETVNLDEAVDGIEDDPTPVVPHVRPKWANVAKAINVIAHLTDDPGVQARADALGAYIRDTWDALGLSLYDEATLYVALVQAGMMTEMASNGVQSGMATPELVGAVAKISQAFTMAVMPWLPDEAKP